jgi:hypothetical protein
MAIPGVADNKTVTADLSTRALADSHEFARMAHKNQSVPGASANVFMVYGSYFNARQPLKNFLRNTVLPGLIVNKNKLRTVRNHCEWALSYSS